MKRHNDPFIVVFSEKKVESDLASADDEDVRFACTGSVLNCLFASVALTLVSLSPARAEEALPFLDVGTQVFSNVSVTSKSATHVFIKHSRGFSGLKLSELDHAALVKLGLEAPDPPRDQQAKPPVKIENPFSKVENPFSKMENPFSRPEFQPKITQQDGKVIIDINHQRFEVDMHFVRGVLWTAFCLWILFCYCTMLICKKSGIKAGLACWLPIVQYVRLLRAAQMSGWWILLSVIPLVGAIIFIVWSIKICQVRGKGFFTVLFLLLPVTTPLGFLYLALSSDGKEDNDSGKFHLSYQTSSAE